MSDITTGCRESMQAPWHLLKKAELAALRERRKEGMRPATIERLRRLVQQCAWHAEAKEAICFHGSLALLCEYDEDWPGAVKHRKMEVAKIRRLHKLEELNPTDGWALQNYGLADLEDRRAILAALKLRTAATSERSGHSETISNPLSFESKRLRAITQAFARRGKAIRYHGSLECSRAVEESGERLNVDFGNRRGLQLTLSVWSDDVFWLGIFCAAAGLNAGWAGNEQYEGNLAGIAPEEIANRFLQTLSSGEKPKMWWPEARHAGSR